MTVPTGPASLADIQTEFGGAGPIGINEYYAGGAYVPNPPPTSIYQRDGGVLTGGRISIGNFLGLTKVTNGGNIWTVPGTYTWQVPSGVNLVRINTVAGGGGGGGCDGGGDDHPGGSGGAGGYWMGYNLAVNGGDILTVVVGSGGLPGHVFFGGNRCPGVTNSGSWNAANGGNSYVVRAGTQVAVSTGGFGGNGAFGDNQANIDGNHPYRGSGKSGTPGTIFPTPTGDPYDEPAHNTRNGSDSNRRAYYPNFGAQNGTGYGTGGQSNGWNMSPYGGPCSSAGTGGMVSIWFGTDPSPFGYSLTIAAPIPIFNLYNRLIAAGWDGQSVLNVNVTIASNGVVYGAPGIPAFDIGFTPPATSQINIVNNGLIIGCGGDGGAAGLIGGSGGPGFRSYGSGQVRVQNTSAAGLGISGGGGGGGGGSGQGGGGAGGRGGGYGSVSIYGASMVGFLPATPGSNTIYGGGQGGAKSGAGIHGTGGSTAAAGTPGAGGFTPGTMDPESGDTTPATYSGGAGGAGGNPPAGILAGPGVGGFGTAGGAGAVGASIVNNSTITWIGGTGNRYGPVT